LADLLKRLVPAKNTLDLIPFLQREDFCNEVVD
jgi:hypothetical protein